MITTLTPALAARVETAARSASEERLASAFGAVLFVEYPEASEAEIEGMVCAEENHVEGLMYALTALEDEQAGAVAALLVLLGV